MHIHYALHFADKTEGGDCITHTTTGTSETSIETKHSGVYYKMFYLICSTTSYLLNMDDIKDFNYIIWQVTVNM